MLDGQEPIIAIHPTKFEKRFRYVDGQDEAVEDVWVTWVKKGVSTPMETSDRVSRVKKDKDKWSVIKPHYDRWLQGQEFQTDGTPIDVWPGVEPHIVQLLKSKNVYSVEDFAAMTDGEVGKLGFPGARVRHAKAKEFLRNKTSIDEVDELRARIAELEAAKDKPNTAAKKAPAQKDKAA